MLHNSAPQRPSWAGMVSETRPALNIWTLSLLGGQILPLGYVEKGKEERRDGDAIAPHELLPEGLHLGV